MFVNVNTNILHYFFYKIRIGAGILTAAAGISGPGSQLNSHCDNNEQITTATDAAVDQTRTYGLHRRLC